MYIHCLSNTALVLPRLNSNGYYRTQGEHYYKTMSKEEPQQRQLPQQAQQRQLPQLTDVDQQILYFKMQMHQAVDQAYSKTLTYGYKAHRHNEALKEHNLQDMNPNTSTSSFENFLTSKFETMEPSALNGNTGISTLRTGSTKSTIMPFDIMKCAD